MMTLDAFLNAHNIATCMPMFVQRIATIARVAFWQKKARKASLAMRCCILLAFRFAFCVSWFDSLLFVASEFLVALFCFVGLKCLPFFF